MLNSQITPAHPQPMPLILANPHVAYTARRVATCKNLRNAFKIKRRKVKLDNIKHFKIKIVIYQLSNDKSNQKQNPWSLHERPASSDKNECLAYNAHLQIYCSSKLAVTKTNISNTKMFLREEKRDEYHQ